jgi:hypothetical protein
MNEIELAYIAGIVDGESYIGIKRITTLKNGRVNPTYQERIQIRMVDESAIKFIAENLGGNYYAEKSHSHKGRPLFCYQASDKKAVKILTILLPYLRIKSPVAKKVMAFREMRNNPEKVAVKTKMRNRWGKEMEFTRYRFSEAHIERCEKFWKECSNLNHGIS